MDFYKAWEKALKSTEIIRNRVQALMTFQDTHVPYVLLSESAINFGDTVVRKGEVIVEKPSLILPPNIPQFEGFELDQELKERENELLNFLIIRGINLPSLRYNNKTHSLDVYEGKLSAAIKHYRNDLAQSENVSTGLLAGPEDCWQFSLLIFICSQVVKNSQDDIRKLFNEYQKKNTI